MLHSQVDLWASFRRSSGRLPAPPAGRDPEFKVIMSLWTERGEIISWWGNIEECERELEWNERPLVEGNGLSWSLCNKGRRDSDLEMGYFFTVHIIRSSNTYIYYGPWLVVGNHKRSWVNFHPGEWVDGMMELNSRVKSNQPPVVSLRLSSFPSPQSPAIIALRSCPLSLIF
jgi:hypothetical protein